MRILFDRWFGEAVEGDRHRDRTDEDAPKIATTWPFHSRMEMAALRFHHRLRS
jgi:hypothetical protein